MRVLITGGAGYIGNELTYRLLQNPIVDRIIIYDNLSRKNYNLFLDTKYPEGKVRFVYGEILDSRKLRKVLKDVDIVYHLAAKVTTPYANDDPHLFEQVNHWGTAELVYAIEEAGANIKKLVYTSSSSVYGVSEVMIDINTMPNPKTFYGSSKLRGEAHIERLFDRIPTYILRCGNVYGYSPSLRFDAVINRFMFEANFNGRINVSGDGTQHRSFIHIDKVTNVMNNIINNNFPSGTYNLVDLNMSVIEIANIIKELYPGLETIFVNQHLSLREIMVKPDERLSGISTYLKKSIKEELAEFKEKFSFSSFE
jgi:UDP-glucose 4-epimerase